MWFSRRFQHQGVKLYKYDGTYWKTVSNTNGKATFPAVSLGTGNMVLGWSKTQGKNTLSSSDYKAGDRIPTKNGKYYMVIFGMSMDRAPSVITKATKFDKVYCVGDSRTADTKMALGVAVPSNVEFIAKVGEKAFTGSRVPDTDSFLVLYQNSQRIRKKQ